MKSNTRIAIAGLLSAAGAVLNAFAAEFNGTEPDSAAPAETPKKTRGKAAAAPVAETPAEPAAPAEPTAPAEETTEGKSYEDLKALIAPLVKEGKGEEVKKVIKKYAGEGGSLKTLEAKHHASFEKDIAALAY
jgi:hypothetical protein